MCLADLIDAKIGVTERERDRQRERDLKSVKNIDLKIKKIVEREVGKS
jgi:hypothetical protein